MVQGNARDRCVDVTTATKNNHTMEDMQGPLRIVLDVFFRWPHASSELTRAQQNLPHDTHCPFCSCVFNATLQTLERVWHHASLPSLSLFLSCILCGLSSCPSHTGLAWQRDMWELVCSSSSGVDQEFVGALPVSSFELRRVV